MRGGLGLSFAAMIAWSAGCTTKATSDAGTVDPRPSPTAASPGTPAAQGTTAPPASSEKMDSGRGTSVGTTAEGRAAVMLPRVEVTESRMTDYGMAIVTNIEVLRHQPIEWMKVGTVLPGSAAHLAGLSTDERILAINDRPVRDYTRTEMLDVFFARERGDRVKLLVISDRVPLPRFVRLVANRRGLERENAVRSGP